MTSILNSLMTGGYTPDYGDTDGLSVYEAWTENMETMLFEMTDNELRQKYFDACIDGDEELAELCKHELDSREPVIDVPPYSTLADEQMWLDDPEHEDRRKDYLENYASDELPL